MFVAQARLTGRELRALNMYDNIDEGNSPLMSLSLGFHMGNSDLHRVRLPVQLPPQHHHARKSRPK